LIFSAFKASRAPQAETAEEARVSERSEFPRRAVSGEEHRAPGRKARRVSGAGGFASFCQDKRKTRRVAVRKLLLKKNRKED